MVRHHEWLGWVASYRQQFSTNDECIHDIKTKKKWACATHARLNRSLVFISNSSKEDIDFYISAYKRRIQFRNNRETGKAGSTCGIITTTNSLPNSILSSCNTSLISEYTALLNTFIESRQTAQSWTIGHSFATTQSMMHFFHSCLQNRNPLFSDIRTTHDIVQLYTTAYHGKIGTLLPSTIKQHCNRLFVLCRCIYTLNNIELPDVNQFRVLFYQSINSSPRQSPVDAATQSPPARKCFNTREVIRLYSVCECIKDKILLTLLFTTGLRVGGVSRCQLQNIYDFETMSVKSVGHTIEKGAVCREFYICKNLRALLHSYISSLPGKKPRFLFPARHHYTDKCCTTAHLQVRFNRLVVAAGIEWKAHIHCTRHTLIAALRIQKTPSALIQMYIGHKTIRTTDAYGILSTEQLVQSMHLPWLEDAATDLHVSQLLHVLDGSRITQNKTLDDETLQIFEKLVQNQKQYMSRQSATHPPAPQIELINE